MATFIYIDGVEDGYAVRWPDGYEVTSSAETGTVNIGRIEIDDPTGSLDIVPLKGAYIVETLAPAGNQRIWTGYIQNLTIDRGPYRTGAGRVWRADCVDVNFDLVRRFDVASSGKRPAETDVVRLSWILNGNLATVGLVYQGTLTNLTDNIKNLDEADYTFLTPMEMLADMAPQCGKRAFAFYNESTAKVELFYDLADAAVNTSSSTISNDIADTSAYPPFIDGSLSRLGEEIYSKGVLRWVGGNTTQERLDTKATYNDHWYTSESSRIGRASTAASWLSTFLEVHSVPQDTLTCTLLLPAAHVNNIREGQRLQVKFTHLPGLASLTYRRVISRVLKRDPTDNYLVQLILDNATGTVIGGGPGVGGFPHQTTCTPGSGDLVQTNTATGIGGLTVALTNPATEGNLLVMSVSTSGGVSSDPTGWTSLPVGGVLPFANGSKMWYRTAVAGDQTWTWAPSGGLAEGAAVIAEFAGGVSFVDSAELVSTDPYNNSVVPGPAVTPTAGSISVIVGLWGWKSDRTTDPTAGTGWTLTGTTKSGAVDRVVMVHKIVSSASGSYTPTINAFVDGNNGPVSDFHSYGAESAAFSCTSTDTPPLPGQWVYSETPTPAPGGGRVTFSTAFPFADGSLKVYVDHVDQTAAITSYDGAAGSFTLAFDPRSWETILVDYQGR